MKIKLIIGANAYACIEDGGRKTDIRLSHGKSAAQSLREYAQEQRERASRIAALANLAERAAAQLEPPEYLQAGDRLWNGSIVTHCLAIAYNRITDKIEGFKREGRPVPEYLLNGRHNLIAGESA